MSDRESRKFAGLRERLSYNQDFKSDWRDPDEAHDGYQLKWVGKNYARLETSTAAATMIYPDVKHNQRQENAHSENLFFTGDNLQVLKHLQNCYKGEVKMIYIDPPYNTGSDGFVYKDKFDFPDAKLKAMLGLTDDEIKRLKIINGRSSHSAWLTFMYPRLKIAKELLCDDGAIFISIDDNEQANLKLLCDEIFGEVNFLGNIVWEKRYGRSNDTKLIASVFDYILLYRKSSTVGILRESRKEYNNAAYNNPDNDPRGSWTSVSFVSQRTKDERPNLVYSLKNPHTGEEIVHETNSWKYNEEKYKQMAKEKRFYWGQDGKQRYPRIKRFLAELSEGLVPVNLWKHQIVGTGDEGTREVKELIGKNIFAYPKPSNLVKQMLEISTNSSITPPPPPPPPPPERRNLL